MTLRGVVEINCFQNVGICPITDPASWSVWFPSLFFTYKQQETSVLLFKGENSKWFKADESVLLVQSAGKHSAF